MNQKKKIITVIGARPQFIKAGTISRILKSHPKIQEILIHTGQHHDPMMSDIFFNELQIPTPTYYLNICGGTHGQMTGRMMESIEKILLEEKPEAVLVYGDTNSTLAGALVAVKLLIPVIHIEAGLRSFNKTMPEEINRIITDHMSNLLFCPTKASVNNLLNEGISGGVFHVGDVMYDATKYAINYNQKNNNVFDSFSFSNKDFALLTVHRADSTHSSGRFQEILEYSHHFAKENNLNIIFPVHPRTRQLLKLITHHIYPKINFIDPISYFEMHALLAKAKYVLTDSGGLQKEAYFHRVPCITLRSETEWIETIESGWNRLWHNNVYHNQKEIDEYGKGTASHTICKIIEGI